MTTLINHLLDRLDELSAKIDALASCGTGHKDTTWLNVAELQDYLPSHPKRQTIYSWTSSRQIPFHKKGRSIMFDKAEIDAWLQNSEHVKSLSDITHAAHEFVKIKRKKYSTNDN